MTTAEQIDFLRKLAEYGTAITTKDRGNLRACADTMEELNEKNEILLKNMDEAWGKGE